MLVVMSECGTDLIGSTEACRLLDIDKRTLVRWISAGRVIPAYRLPGKNGAYLFRRADIEALVVG
jgi:excisionase family DNA binding protein